MLKRSESVVDASRRRQHPEETHAMQNAKLFAIAVLVIAAIIVIVQNTAAVETRLLFATVTMPRAVLLLLTLSIGFVLGILFTYSTKRRKAASK
jgi:uncharacterized integral membrane protein